MTGYCCRCKTNQEIKSPTQSMSKNGRHMVKGLCTVCNTKMCKFI